MQQRGGSRRVSGKARRPDGCRSGVARLEQGRLLQKRITCDCQNVAGYGGGGGGFSVWSQSYFPSFFLSIGRGGDKRATPCQANSPQPTGYRLDDREQIKQKDECSLGGSGSISDSSDPRQFLSSPSSAFSVTQLGTNPIVKGDCREH